MLAAIAAAPACAQMAASVAVQNDDEFRGYSLSAHHPVAILNLSYEHPSSLYINSSTIGSLSKDGDPALLGAIENVGYARRLNPALSIDSGLVRSDYFEGYGWPKSAGYTEVYIGIAGRNLSSHVYVSDDYFGHHASTLYGEVEYGLETIDRLRLSAHLGVLTDLSAPSGAPLPRPRPDYDWRIMASRQFGAFELHAAISGGGPGDDYYDARSHTRTTLVVGAGWAF